MNSKNDFLTKELVNTFSYTTATQDRDSYAEVSIKGRKYLKFGTLQAVTIVANKYKVFNSKTGQSEYWIFAGLAKQHPCDSKMDKDNGYEVANLASLNDPFWVMKVNKSFGNNTFRKMVTAYVDDMDFEFIKTREEMLSNDLDPKKYTR